MKAVKAVSIQEGRKGAQVIVHLQGGGSVTRHAVREGYAWVGWNPDPRTAEMREPFELCLALAKIATERAKVRRRNFLESTDFEKIQALEADLQNAQVEESEAQEAYDEIDQTFPKRVMFVL